MAAFSYVGYCILLVKVSSPAGTKIPEHNMQHSNQLCLFFKKMINSKCAVWFWFLKKLKAFALQQSVGKASPFLIAKVCSLLSLPSLWPVVGSSRLLSRVACSAIEANRLWGFTCGERRGGQRGLRGDQGWGCLGRAGMAAWCPRRPGSTSVSFCFLMALKGLRT